MSLAAIFRRGQWRLTAPLVQVEVLLGAGPPLFSIVGLLAEAVQMRRTAAAF